jgi:hypothetical protein
MCLFVTCHNRSYVGNALWSHGNASGASAPASALPGKGTARTRPRAHKTRAEREEAHRRHQEKCQSGSTRASLPSSSPSLVPLAHSSRSISKTRCPFQNPPQNACKVMAKDLVRTRRYIQKFFQMRTQLQAVGLRIQTLRSNQQMAEAMRGATRVLRFPFPPNPPPPPFFFADDRRFGRR